ncbi:DUF4163 domain-containing protein [Altererythrobacter arenosus]|uniref:DUF4163 domain-containing protein n=1 Tax=Altererythrobacter arenosus TaxID=3032592 RepID=A0ABY8FSM3_9SPHN|nr:DUF4163 domain-containing protein [Altererythrobacter sp. CAU 1644]WFL78013.1 DUF4163 domain-containing protein [Altererythrobacter sp. CAU 1644]
MFPIIAVACLAACSAVEEDEALPAAAAKTATAQATASAASPAEGVSFSRSQEDGGASWEFKYSWPAEVAARPELARKLEAERTKLLAEEQAGWLETKEYCPEDSVSCRSRSLQKDWKKVAEIPGWLSLSADIYAYTGGAHGNSGFAAMVWDDRNAQGMEPVAMFKTPSALEQAFGGKHCAALNKEREKRRGMPVIPVDDGGFDSCPKIDEFVVIVGSSDGEKFDRIGLLAAPYVAGPYAEGSYEVTLPVDAAIIAAVKPEYSGLFGAGR